jgi:hypothetical protein
VANTDFEGGDDDHGYGDYIFLVICAILYLLFWLFLAGTTHCSDLTTTTPTALSLGFLSHRFLYTPVQ